MGYPAWLRGKIQPSPYPGGWEYGEHPFPGAIFQWSQGLDSSLDYVTDALTFTGLATLLQGADTGNAADMVRLSEEIESKDLHLQAVAATRRMALTGMDWTIEPGDTHADQDAGLAAAAAEYVTGCFDRNPELPSLCRHLAKAIGPNLAVAEIVWEGTRPVRFLSIPAHRLNIDYSQSPDIRVLTMEDMGTGIIAAPGKFIIHRPEGAGYWPFLSCLTRAQAKLYLIKAGAIADWATFAEVYGMPIRVGKHGPNATPQEKNDIKTALASLGSDGYAVVSEAVNLNFLEANRTAHPYKEFIDWIERKQSIGYLGQTLTTDTSGGTGTYAAASIHDRVRRAITEDDVRAEADTIERQLFAPMIAFEFPRKSVPIPRFVRTFREETDTERNLRTLEGVIARLGLPVARDQIYELVGLPKPEPGEAVLDVADLPVPAPAAMPGMGGAFG